MDMYPTHTGKGFKFDSMANVLSGNDSELMVLKTTIQINVPEA